MSKIHTFVIDLVPSDMACFDNSPKTLGGCSLKLTRRDGGLLGVCSAFLTKEKLNVVFTSNKRGSLDASVAISSKK